MFVTHPVADYDAWRPVFEADKPRRAAFGITDVAVLRDADDPNSIFTFSGDKVSRLDVTYADQDAEDAFWG